MTALALNFNWSDQETSLKLDFVSLVLAVALHVPLYFMKFDTNKSSINNEPKNRLVAVDLIDPVVAAPAPPPAPVVKADSLMQKLKMMVKREPPPPPPPPKAVKPDQPLATAPQAIKIEPNLKLPAPVQAKLETKSGFKTTADAKLVEEKQISLKTIGTGIAPISAKKLGTLEDRGALKSDKGNFKIARSESLKSIGGGDATLSGGAAPTIAIRTGSAGSTEKFSAALPQKADKGRLGAVGVSGLGGEQKLGLRDAMIARDAQVGQIAVASSRGGMAGGVAGGVPGGVVGGVVGAKKDAGRFQGGQVGGVIGGTGTGPATAGTVQRVAAIPAKPAQKKSMFSITGPLKDRKIISQALPEYPGWAQAQGIEAAVILEFVVLPDGTVKEDIVVRRTSGYPQLDQSAVKALRRWRFVPISDDENRSEVGQITFNYSLN